MGSGLGGAAGWEGVFLSHDEQACLALMMSSCMHGQNTAGTALLTILVTPWWAEWRTSRAFLCRLTGRTARSLYRTTGPTVDRWSRWRWYCSSSLGQRVLSLGDPSLMSLLRAAIFLIIGGLILNILPGYRCDVGHGANVGGTDLALHIVCVILTPV